MEGKISSLSIMQWLWSIMTRVDGDMRLYLKRYLTLRNSVSLPWTKKQLSGGYLLLTHKLPRYY